MNTAQEIFDYVVSNLIKQGRQSIDGDQCLYRGPDGTKCAAGWLISDDQYDPDIEGTAISCISRDLLPPIIDQNLPLVIALQSAHDLPDPTVGFINQKDFVQLFVARARSIARIHHLQWNFG